MTSLALLLAVAAAAAPLTPKQIAEARADPAHQLKTFRFDPKSPLESRLQRAPGWLLDGLAAADGVRSYKTADPTPEQLALVRAVYSSLPLKMRKVLDERLIGVFIVEDYSSNGLTNWALDDQNRVYPYTVLNAASFRATALELLAKRDASLFTGTPEAGYQAGNDLPGVYYTLLHEGFHAYDYVAVATPYVQPGGEQCIHPERDLAVSWDVWKSYDAPKPEADFPQRKKLKFFHLDGGPLVAPEEAPSLYDALSRSPFPSLYAAKSWAEDAAELFTLYTLTRKLGMEYAVIYGDTLLAPMNGRALKRAERLYRKFRL